MISVCGVSFTKTYIKVDEHQVVNEGRWRNMYVDMGNNWWGVKALKTSSFDLQEGQWNIGRTIKPCGE